MSPYVIRRTETEAAELAKLASKVIKECGAMREEPSNKYEKLRFRVRLPDGTTEIWSVYRNAKGREKWHPKLWRRFQGGSEKNA